MESILDFNTVFESAVPSYAEFDEYALYTIASVEESYTELCKNIGIYELSLVMNEATDAEEKDKKNIFKKFGEMIKSFLAKVAGLIKDVLARVIEFIASKTKDKGIERYLKKKDGIVAVAKKKLDDKKEKKARCVELNFKEAEKICGNLSKAGAALIAKIEKNEIDGSVAEGIKADLYKAIGVASGADSAAITAAFEKVFIAKNEEVNVYEWFSDANNVKAAIDKLGSGKSGEFVKSLTEVYKNLDKKLKDVEKKAKGAENAESMKAFIDFAKSYTKLSCNVVGAVAKVYRQQLAFEVGNLFVLALVAKKETEEGVSESAYAPDPSSFQTELASLFDF